MNSVSSIEKTIFSDFHRSFNKLLDTLGKLDQIPQDNLIDIIEMNQNINKIIQSIDTLNYKLLKKSSKKKKSF